MSFVRLALLATLGVLFLHFLVGNVWILRDIADIFDPHIDLVGSNENVDIVFEKISEVIGDRCIRESSVLKEHSRDRSHSDTGRPDIVTYPTTPEEVQEIIRICNEHYMIIVPQGYNSGVEGGSTPLFGGVVISSRNLTKIIKLHEDDMQLTVESGIGIQEINDYLESFGYSFNCLPNSYPSIGGAVSTSASGLESLVYGTMKDNVINLEVVLSHGKKIQTRSRSYKSSAGYDLTSLFIGSEGTLGFITQVTLKIHKIQNIQYAGIAVFDKLEDVGKSAVEVKQRDLAVNRMEILNGDAMNAVNKYFNVSYPLIPHIFLDVRGNDEEEVKRVIGKVERVLKENNGRSISFTSDQVEREEMWKSRNKFFFALVQNRDDCPGCRFFHTDLCIPISSFVDVIMETEKDFAKYFGHCPIVSHAGDANFHVGLPVDYDNPEEIRMAEECAKRAAERAIKVGGTGSGEHGIGLMKKDILVLEFGNDGIQAMKDIKKALDPRNIMNPGKVLDL